MLHSELTWATIHDPPHSISEKTFTRGSRSWGTFWLKQAPNVRAKSQAEQNAARPQSKERKDEKMAAREAQTAAGRIHQGKFQADKNKSLTAVEMGLVTNLIKS